MLKTLLRAIIGIQGALALFIASQALLAPHVIAGQLGYVLVGPLGLSSFRADIGGFFAFAGIFMLLGAVTASRTYVLPPLVLTGLALAGRAGTAVETGFQPEFIQPMTVEAVTLVVLLAAFAAFRER
jgi:hypothetical protein